jgi:hypothetical protein
MNWDFFRCSWSWRLESENIRALEAEDREYLTVYTEEVSRKTINAWYIEQVKLPCDIITACGRKNAVIAIYR